MFELRYNNEQLPEAMRLQEAYFQVFEEMNKKQHQPSKEINRKQDIGKSHYDITRFCDPKCLNYQVMKDPMTNVLHFKTTMAPVSFIRDKRDTIMYKLFIAT